MRSARLGTTVLLLAALLAATTGVDAQGRKRRRRPPPEVDPASFDRAGPDVGDAAPDFALQDLDGARVRLSDLWSERHLILVLGSYTSPEFRRVATGSDRIETSHPGAANIVILYTREAHPSGSASPYGEDVPEPADNARAGIRVEQPTSLDDRRAAARLAVERLGIRQRVLLDGMDDAAWKAYGPAPNNAFLIDRHGFVVARQGWYDPEAMEGLLETLLEVERRRQQPAPPPAEGTGGR